MMKRHRRYDSAHSLPTSVRSATSLLSTLLPDVTVEGPSGGTEYLHRSDLLERLQEDLPKARDELRRWQTSEHRSGYNSFGAFVVCANQLNTSDGTTRLCASCQTNAAKAQKEGKPYQHYSSRCGTLDTYRSLVQDLGAFCDLVAQIYRDAATCLRRAFEAETPEDEEHEIPWTCTHDTVQPDDAEPCCCPTCAIKFVEEAKALSSDRMPSMQSVKNAYTLEREGSLQSQTETTYLRSIFTVPDNPADLKRTTTLNRWNSDRSGWDYCAKSQMHPSQIVYDLSAAAGSIMTIQETVTDLHEILNAKIRDSNADGESITSHPESLTVYRTGVVALPKRYKHIRSRSDGSYLSITSVLSQNQSETTRALGRRRRRLSNSCKEAASELVSAIGSFRSDQTAQSR
ncbi:hypothetical protein FFLO_01540 [Filobasidium floriforme]|uniref:Uncharacterized protein n=1 Tax=Filobasidium floriforme TaxID=5210 RepID=A0A8K0NUS0_9TREE|nr:uncharacterized protein HD553DRAFT_363191 [Filobasidium floriforme]KAG7562982.1 hypothetical protein FFLO_01540 [Filobasidium floriforme]KAH8079283.1 hypothetical protein HD553DRAFT_363191 [Filobasidium floriforme]